MEDPASCSELSDNARSHNFHLGGVVRVNLCRGNAHSRDGEQVSVGVKHALARVLQYFAAHMLQDDRQTYKFLIEVMTYKLL